MSQSLDRLARRISQLEKDVRNNATQPRLGHSSLDGGAIYVFDPATGYPTGIFGRQYDGTTGAASVGGTFPVAASQPFVTEIVGGLRIYWDGTYADGSPARMDFSRVSVHAVLDTDLIDPLDPAQLVGEITSATGGEVTVGLPYVEHFVYLIVWTQAGKFSVESDVAFGTPRFVGSGDLEPGAIGTDGLAPTEQPVVTATAGFKSAMLTWPAITNADPVWYEIAASASNGFTPVAGDVVGNTTGTMANIITAHSPVYIRVRAIDGDGAGPWSDQDSVTPIAGIDQAALNAAIAAVNADLDAAEATLATVQADLNTAEGTLATVQADLDTAEGLITTAQNAADAAQATATAAGTSAAAAQTTANGKNKVTYSTAAPGSTANTAGDVWFQRDGTTGRIIAMFEGTGGTSWTQRTLDGLVIAAIDAGTITTGTLSAARIAASSLSIGQVNGLQSTIDNAQASAIAASVTAAFTNLNPTFSDWPGGAGTAPTGYGVQGNAPTKETSVLRTLPWAARWNVTATGNDWGMSINSANFANMSLGQYVVVDTEVFLTSGTFSGAGIWINWDGMGGTTRATLRFDDAGASPATGRWYRFTKVIKRPAAATGTQTGWSGRIYANFAFGTEFGSQAVKNIVVDRVGVRLATAEEILAYESTANIAGAQATAISTAASDANAQYGETKTLVAGWRVTGQTTINGGQIATDTVTAVQIAANTITANEIAALTITGAQIAANTITAAKIAALTITGNEIAANTITAAKLVANTITANEIAANTITSAQIAAGTITATQIASDYVYTGVVTANQVVSGTLSAVVALLGEITTAISGRRITISSADGFRAIDAVGDTLVQIPTDSAQDISIKADVVANSITALGPIALRASTNELAKSAKLILRGKTTAPATPAIVAPTWQSVSVQPTNAHRGLAGNYNATNARTYQAWSDGVNSGVWVFDNAGAHVPGEEWTESTSAAVTVTSAARLGATIYLLLKNTTAGKWYIRRVNATTHALIGTDFDYGNISTYESVAMTIFSTTTLVTVTRNITTSTYQRRQFNITGEIAPSAIGTGTLQTGGVNWNIIGGPVVDIYEGPAEGTIPTFNSSTSRLFIYLDGQAKVNAFQSLGAGNGNPAEDLTHFVEFPIAFEDKNVRLLTYNDGIGTIITYSKASGLWNYYDGTRWTTESSTWKITTTWRDSDATGGTHETDQGPVASISMKKRARLLVTAPPIPDAGGTDDADAVSIYVGRGDGSRTTQWRQATPAAGVRSATIQTVTFSGTNPPAANDFPAATPAAIVDSSTAITLLDANGDGRLRNMSIDSLTRPAATYAEATKSSAENVAAGASNFLSGTTISIAHDGKIHPGGVDAAYHIWAVIDVENTGSNGVLSVALRNTGTGFDFPGEAVFKGASGDRCTITQHWGWYPTTAETLTCGLRATNSGSSGTYNVRNAHTRIFAMRIA